MRIMAIAFLTLFGVPSTLLAQAASQDNSISGYQKGMYSYVKEILINSAEKMPDEFYDFRPTDSVRSYGQIVGHLADAQYSFCSVALGEDNPRQDIEKTKRTKTELIAALKESFAYCDRAYDALTDATAAQPVKLLGEDAPRLGALEVNLMHDFDHYGNLATYMRLKSIVPPTSAKPPQVQPLGLRGQRRSTIRCKIFLTMRTRERFTASLLVSADTWSFEETVARRSAASNPHLHYL